MAVNIPRTAWNVYNREDADTWLVLPKKKVITSFVDVSQLTISKKEENFDFGNVDLFELIKKIQMLKPKLATD